jgi:hypothetical protein
MIIGGQHHGPGCDRAAAPATADGGALRRPLLIPGWERKWEPVLLAVASCCSAVLGPAPADLR